MRALRGDEDYGRREAGLQRRGCDVRCGGVPFSDGARVEHELPGAACGAPAALRPQSNQLMLLVSIAPARLSTALACVES